MTKEERKQKSKKFGEKVKNSEKELIDKAQAKRDKRLNRFSDIQVRILVGFIYISINVIAILIHPLATLAAVVFTAAYCANEFFRMERSDAKLPNEVLGIIAAAAYPIAAYIHSFYGVAIVCFLFVLALLIWYVLWLPARINDVSISFFGATYCGISLAGLILIRCSLGGGLTSGLLTLGIVASVWMNDAFAYLVGSAIGKHKFSPRISPKKTWEGVIAGVLTSGIIWACFIFIPGLTISLPQAFISGIICGAVGILGDLAESRMKRNAGVKDTGNIMPGHGGLLDRSDSLFLVSIAATFLLIGMGIIPFTI